VDGMTEGLRNHEMMPVAAPLAMPEQDLTMPFTDGTAPGPSTTTNALKWRLATFLPAVVTSFALIAIFADWFKKDGFAGTEIAMLLLVAFSTFWITLSVASATIGLLWPKVVRAVVPPWGAKALDVALLVPVYSEDTDSVFARLSAMREQLTTHRADHRFAIFVLSDTQDPTIAEREKQQTAWLRRSGNDRVPLYYRRRSANTDRKTGNIRDWIENWGARWNAFVVLDADSLMGANAIIDLSNRMAASDGVGLIQTVPRLIAANSIFSRVQQFANNVYGRVLADGLERWCGNEANYWGHNAIVRTRAFAACAGLPKLSGKGALSGIIKSHDFVEAALLRRAGWSVQLVPSIEETYEEIPQTLIDYVLRDRRWCQGNLQHLRLIMTPGLHGASRFHMIQGAMSYIASVVWFALLLLWTVMGRSEEANVIRYFSEANPLFPQWPQMDSISRLLILFCIFGLLLAPKIFALAAVVWRSKSLAAFGGPVRFLTSAFSEIVLSFVLAPILMVQHVIAVIRAVIGFDSGWAPQNRRGGRYRLTTLMRFHLLETVTGILLGLGIAAQLVSLWLLPIALSLLLAVPISHFSGIQLSRSSSLSKLMTTPQDWVPARIIELARGRRNIGVGGSKRGERLSPLTS